MSAGGPWKIGDQVWVKTGGVVSDSGVGDHEELGMILSLPTPTKKTRKGASRSSKRADDDDDASIDGILVKFTVSGYDMLVTEDDRIRPMEDAGATGVTDGSGRKLRRSGRSTNNTSVLMNVGSAAATKDGVGGSVATKKKKKFAANAVVSVTPSPTEFDSASSSNSSTIANKCDGDDAMEEDSKPASAKNAKKRKPASAVAKTTSNKKAKKALSKPKASGSDNAKVSSPYFAKGSKGKDDAKPSAAQSKKKKASGGKKLILASSEEDEDKNTMVAKSGKVAKTTTGKKQSAAASKTKKGNKKKPTTTKKATASKGKPKEPFVRRDEATDSNARAVGNEPDGNGGLNQPCPWIVEYSKTGRATCRSCDEKIGKGEVRVGHTPLFRGKPGFMVYRHLHCAVFSEEIHCAEDVENYDTLTEEDYVKLAEQVDVSKVKIIEERREIRPDELVQKSFQGETRSEPAGFTGSLLPFQVEGLSWMIHQEKMMEGEIRGGILADEMGMGKTIQTIATILDNRPKLQHTKPGMKHPPTNAVDLKERQDEEKLWDKTKVDWSSEMELLKVPKKLRSRDGGATRAGTLVICPVIALSQWKSEIEKFTEDGTLTVGTYHGPDRESVTPREMMKKYDVVLTTYQVLESDFRKMTSPNRVECPNCGGKFKIDKLPIHLKYFCGDAAERTEAQARQRRSSDREGGDNRIQDRRSGNAGNDDSKGGDKKGMKKQSTASKEKSKDEKKKKPPKQKKPAKKPRKKKAGRKQPPESIPDALPSAATPSRAGSRRTAARKAATQISRSATEWAPPDGDDTDSKGFQSDAESSGDDDACDSGNESSSEGGGYSSESSEDSALERAREKQRQALEMSKSKEKSPMAKKKKQQPPAKGNGGKKKATNKKKPASKAKGKGKPKTFDDEGDDYSSSGSTGSDVEIEIDMAALVAKAMAGAKNSVLHSLCWWRIVLDEAHFIKTRSSQTANAAFSLIGVNRWCLSGTPLQNRVGEFYSLVRFLRLDPMAFYYCRAKDCNCKSMHYRIHAGRCEGCGHSGIQHYSHFNKYVLNPIQRDGYTGDGRRAMFLLKNEVLDKALLRRTKETKAADMELPPRIVKIQPVRLHPIEEDFYSALYTQTKSSFDDYVDSGTLLNNYAHIFDLLIRMRQAVDHPYLVIYSKKNTSGQAGLSQLDNTPAIANGSADCDLCHEPPTDRVVATCCGAAYCRSCVLEFMATSNSMAASANLLCPSCRAAFSIDLQARADIEDDSSLKVSSSAAKSDGSGGGMPSLKELRHVATGSVLRRINLAEFATSSKIEALTRELVLMRKTSPGSKAIVFSQFVNMLDLIRWRLHSDPYLEDIGLGCRALHGGMNVKARDACLKDFRENNNVRVLLMSLKAGGVALNLTCANYIYLMDPWWNPAAEMQAIDRTHRLGQYRPIRAVRFIAENTVEERILQLQEKKRLVFDGTVGRDAGSLKMLTVDDMKSLFA